MTEPLVLVAYHDPVRATYAALTDTDDDESVRTVVLTDINPAFCAGVDLKEAQRDRAKYPRSSARGVTEPNKGTDRRALSRLRQTGPAVRTP